VRDDGDEPVLIRFLDALESVQLGVFLLGFGVAFVILGESVGRIVGGVLVLLGIGVLSPSWSTRLRRRGRDEP
jgi:hypothetical protein